MAKKVVYEVYVDLGVGDDFTLASEPSKSAAYQIAKNAIEKGVLKEEGKVSTFYSPYDINKVTVNEREVEDGK